MALRIALLMFLVVASVACVFLTTRSLLPKFAWNIRYGDALQDHKQLVNDYLRHDQIADIASKYSLTKWYVCGSGAALERSSIYGGILKFCSTDPEAEEERIIAWVNEQGKVERYIRVSKHPKASCEDRITDLPMSMEQFAQLTASLGFKKCCHASLLDMKGQRYGIASYNQTPQLYYEYEISVDLWLYWETDRQGNILARGAHDSP